MVKLIPMDGPRGPYTPTQMHPGQAFLCKYIFMVRHTYMSNCHIPKRPVKPGANPAAGQGELQLRAGIQPAPKRPPQPRSLGSSALPLPSCLDPAFWRQREDLITPINGNIASKSLKWFQKTSATARPRGKGCHLPFLSEARGRRWRREHRTTASSSKSCAQAQGSWWEHPLSPSHRVGLPIPKPSTQRGAMPALRAQRDLHGSSRAQ